jgi:hypothetical protein
MSQVLFSREKVIQRFSQPLKCHFCNTEITETDGIRKNSLVIHSLDGNHKNWDLKNKVPAHNHCHVAYHYHKDKNMVGENNPKWKGDKAQQESILRRKQRQNRIAYEAYYNLILPFNVDVHHINGNRLDDSIENLAVLSHQEHCKKTQGERHKQALREIKCMQCGKIFFALKCKHRRFCSQICYHTYLKEVDV